MRIKNKEIRARRQRKEQKIKDANRIIRAEYGDRKPTAPAPKKVASATRKAAPAKAAADAKPKAAPKPKKAEGE